VKLHQHQTNRENMKKLINTLAAITMAVAVAGLPLTTFAQNQSPEAREKAAAKKGTGPFNGKINAVDARAGTVTVGNRTFKVTSETKVTNGSLASANVGDKSGGAFRTADDGSLIATTIWFGSKPEKK
jgi:hypothetical protein